MTDSKNLKNRINQFKDKISLNNNYMVFEPNNLDLFIDRIFLNFSYKISYLNNNKMIKKIINSSFFAAKSIISNFWNSLKIITEKLNSIKFKFDQLENKLEQQELLINESVKTNKQIKNDVYLLHQSIKKLTDQFQIRSNFAKVENAGMKIIDNEKLKFYQEENLRIGSELLETKKKFDMVKNEIEKYEEQRSNLIAKINSVNEALENTNVVTSVFTNEVTKPKVSIIDHNKLDKNNNSDNNQDVNEAVKNIFLNRM